ncbi:MAG: peptidylprolyl isomerase [Bacteroidia bacterium]|nr:peptidylprolyl isomerase [Bacteroidia bacterium]
MSAVKMGDTVLVHYTGTFDDGNIFDSSVERGEPLQFTMGEQQVIPGFENGVLGMVVGESKKVHIVAVEAYGERSDENLIEVPSDQLPDTIPLLPGTPLNMQTPEGYVLPVSIFEVKEGVVVIDANHPLAGKDLNFDLELVEIL